MRFKLRHDNTENKVKLKVEGLHCHKLISQCVAHNITIQNLSYINELEIVLTVKERQYSQFLQLTKNQYIVTVLGKSGTRFTLKQIFNRKSILIGFAVFLLLIGYRGQFVSDIYIDGLKNIPKEEMYKVLEDNGLYVGCSKKVDILSLKDTLYNQMGDRLNWIYIKIKGTTAYVEVVEKAPTLAKFDYKVPCNIIAKKDGYLTKIVAKNGRANLAVGDFVRKGQLLIGGTKTVTVPAIGESTNGKPMPPVAKQEYFHALGDFYAKAIYHFNVNQERYEVVKEETGKDVYGIQLEVGDFKWSSYHLFKGFDRSELHAFTLIDLAFDGLESIKFFEGRTPPRIVIKLIDCKEIVATKRERSEEEISVLMKKVVRDKLKAGMPKSAQILKQDLKYDATPWTVKVTVNLETLEQIGEEQAITTPEV